MRRVKIKDFFIGEGQPLTIIAGPCVIESEEHTLYCAETLAKMMQKFNVNFIFKASYDKANRSSIHSFRGPGVVEGLRILEKVKTEVGLPVLTDIHTPEEAEAAKEVCDVLQIPAFLCRQTDLLVACAKTQKPVQIKKGQFLAPHDMGNIIDKMLSCGNSNILLCDRGTCFGYNNLVSDMRGIPIMQGFGFPVTFDASHSVQLPASQGTSTGGQREFTPVLARAAVAVGCDSVFIECHPKPDEAKSDRGSIYSLEDMPALIAQLVAIRQALAGVLDA